MGRRQVPGGCAIFATVVDFVRLGKGSERNGRGEFPE